jgi:hypothetical protein
MSKKKKKRKQKKKKLSNTPWICFICDRSKDPDKKVKKYCVHCVTLLTELSKEKGTELLEQSVQTIQSLLLGIAEQEQPESTIKIMERYLYE